jgi:hypothetical protein
LAQFHEFRDEPSQVQATVRHQASSTQQASLLGSSSQLSWDEEENQKITIAEKQWILNLAELLKYELLSGL